jgi:hypothetical protein
MTKSSKMVALILIGSIGVLWGFKSCLNARHDYIPEDGGAFGSGPATRPAGSHGHRGTTSHWFWGAGRSRTSGSSSGSRSSSFRSSGSSRGGFGSSGHSAHS